MGGFLAQLTQYSVLFPIRNKRVKKSPLKDLSYNYPFESILTQVKDLSRSAFFYTIYKMLLFIQGKTFPILLINYLCPFGYNFQESNIMYKSIIIGFSIGLLIAIKAASKCQKEPFNLHVSKIFYIVAFVNFILLLFYAFIFTRFRVNSWILMTVSIFYYVSVIIQGPLITRVLV